MSVHLAIRRSIVTLGVLVAPRAAITPLRLAATPARLTAQSAGRADTLLARLTAEALATNPGLQSTDATARAAAARVSPAGALPDPTLSAGVMDLTLPRFGFRQSDFTEVDLELSQDLPWPGTLGARTRAAESAARERVADVAAQRRRVALQMATAYYRLRYLVAARATLQRQRALLGTAVDIATTRYATGSSPQSDALQARVAVARLEAEDADLEMQEVAQRATLTSMRNAPEPDSIAVEPVRPEAVLAEPHPALSTGDSLPWHPRVLARRAAVEVAEQTVRIERLAARPDLTFTARYGARPLGSDFFSAFVGLRLPTWSGRKQSRVADAARYDLEAAKASEAEEVAELTAELRTVQAQVTSSRRRLDLLTKKVIPAAQATVEAVLRGYRLGQGDFLTLLAAEDSLYRAQLDAALVAAEHLTRLVMLQQLLLREDGQ
jgi:outer membrane protein, heavy metal efflux system